MLWTSDVVKDPWFPLVKDPSGSMSSYHLSRFTPRVISSNGKGDRPVESLEVKVSGGWEQSRFDPTREASNPTGRSKCEPVKPRN